MNTTPENDIIEAVRSGSPALRSRVLTELLADLLKSRPDWPVPVSDRKNEVIAFLFPRPGGSSQTPPRLSVERETELNTRLKSLDDSRDLRDYIAELNSSGRES